MTNNQDRLENPPFIRVLVSKEADGWIACALEMDVVGVGDSREAALADLRECIQALIAIAKERGDPSLILSPASKELFEKYRQAIRAEMRALVGDSRQDETLFRAAGLPLSPQSMTEVAQASV